MIVWINIICSGHFELVRLLHKFFRMIIEAAIWRGILLTVAYKFRLLSRHLQHLLRLFVANSH